MEKGVLVLGSNRAALIGALALARASVPVQIVTADEILDKGAGEGIPPTGTPCEFRSDISLELEVFRSPHVTIHYNSRLTGLTGTSGAFTARIERSPRYIDETRCSGCGKCEEACPVTIDGRKSIFSYGRNRVPAIYSIRKQGYPPCRLACPADVNAQGYVALIRAGKYRQALALEREANPWAGVCGRVCQRPCELNCSRNGHDQAVAIRDLKRFIAEYDYGEKPPKKPSRPEKAGKKAASEPKVAIVGGGPAGLTCGKYLCDMGYRVTILESRNDLGGMVAWAIPEFRLPRQIVKNDLAFILSPLMDIVYGRSLGRDFTIDDLRKQGYKAIFIGIGAQKGMELNIPGNEPSNRILNALDFLQKVENREEMGIGKRVLVIGGGNTAMDAARIALRLGAQEVIIVYRRTKNEMPALSEEVMQAEEEGVHVMELTSPLEYVFEGTVLKGLKVIMNTLGAPDETGRAKPVPLAGSEKIIPCDMIITALGQKIDHDTIRESGVEMTVYGTIKVDAETCQTNLPGVFAGGDAVTGAATVVNAVGAGKRAAVGIHSFLQDVPMPREPEKPVTTTERIQELILRAREIPRVHPPSSDLKKRVCSFIEVEGCFSEEDAKQESERCFNCGDCSLCMECERTCSEVKAVCHHESEKVFDIEARTIVVADERDSEKLAEVLAVTHSRELGFIPGSAGLIFSSREGVLLGVSSETAGLHDKDGVLGKILDAPDLPAAAKNGDAADHARTYSNLCASGQSMLDNAAAAGKSKSPCSPVMEGAQPATGVFLCYCGGSMETQVKGLGSYAGSLKGVALAKEIGNMCSDEALREIRKTIEERSLTHAVLGGCACCTSSRICEGCNYQRVRAKKRLLEAIPLPVQNIELFNIRELGAWVDQSPPGGESEKLRSLVSMAVQRLMLNSEMDMITVEREPAVLIADIGKDTMSLASMLQKAGLKPHVYGRGFSGNEARILHVSDSAPSRIRWEKGNFLAVFGDHPEEKTLKIGACVSVEPPAALDPFISNVLKKGSGVFPGIFLTGEFTGLPDRLRELAPHFLTARISSYLGERFTGRPVYRLHVEESLCRTCGRCIEVCPYGFISKAEGDLMKPIFNLELCQGCGLCAMICSTHGLEQIPSMMKQYEQLLDAALCPAGHA